MLAIETLRTDLAALPGTVRLGLGVSAIGGAADLVTHASFSAGSAGNGTELSAHLVTFAGMVLVLAGVVVDGVRQTRARRRATGHTTKGGS